MSKDRNVAIDGVDQWLYLIKRFNQNPKEALATMEKHNQDVASVLVYLEEILNAYTLHPMDREKLGKVKDLLANELDGTLCRNGIPINECNCC